ncbi:hypothetical protein A3H89_00785 [Candidatus Amesbacteria bacterium RIFCSPLOWO2_02_FULL_48_11]|uniref:Uncharacterized protein n=2 Tax=Candidatus Amesiibacteriota TaxID=1752730 RepID=A0A1F4ZB19_9BACT|nr:MAG: hypothetical protein UY33_C0032G0025 [Candidatus Amesbacteria bacterium GW2011_GWA1_48_9]OGC90118.1 MAG: hypothetical protein A2V48_02650 [Candidatus Amesbacteria bacterium RBG_19FT_COMBO_48_16]OGC95727.1 MAG: hypothetical protein A3C34_01150 [Candidatus Amesbacteria bacterium RIFCSPHIGHO2_02_FULL_48_21]OGC99159.1 MAG: hypothetical protein A2W16_03625 [Candidatus Amesbacteria bacterium RBG_16_48_31]OGD00413.1 MAG: hypothetical protein A2702_02310 [Candidatus Amesbacteria bacterium RIFCS
MTLEEILNLVTHELQLSPDESSQLKHYFSELVSYRLLTHLHGHLTAAQQDHIRQLFTQEPPFDPDLISRLAETTRAANTAQLLDQAVRASLTELCTLYPTQLSPHTKDLLTSIPS